MIISRIVILCCLFSGPVFALEANNGDLPVKGFNIPCASDEECVLTDANCNQCCEYRAITVSKQESYEIFKRRICEAYEDNHGAMCDCEAAKTPVPKCVKSRCEVQYEAK